MFQGAIHTEVKDSNLTHIGRDQIYNVYNVTMSHPRGIVYDSGNGTLHHLPLEQVDIGVFMVDVSARVSLRQTFSNPSGLATGHAKYVFPVPARAAVCAFELQFSDGRVIIGISKEKSQAAKEYSDAIRAEKASGLVDWVTDDMFIVSVGSINANQTVTANLEFVMDLMDDELKDEVRLQLPMSVGGRYGPVPVALATASAASSKTALSIAVDIQMSGDIRKVTSPTHPTVVLAPQTSPLQQMVTFSSPTFLMQSFVLSVHADGIDAPRCFAEQDPRGSGSIAMQLTFVPNFKFLPVSNQEYIFLVDRSGSMKGSSIQIVKRALLRLLPMLPNEQTIFNIFSFGSEVDALWRKSVPYNQICLDLAMKHIHGMTANYGGTELGSALDLVFRSRNAQTSTMVFILTDGKIHDGDRLVSAVANEVKNTKSSVPLRVFALGIGDQVSSTVVEGIAHAGNGECLFAVEGESIENKCAKLLCAGRFPCIESVSIDWGIPGDTANSATDLFGPSPTVQQSPSQVQKIYPAMRFVVFALTTQSAIPQQVILHGKFNSHEGQVMVVVPVSSVKMSTSRTKHRDIPLVHTLAARHRIADLVRHRATVPTAVNLTTVEDVYKVAIVQLATKYQLASRYTSFLAVDKETVATGGQMNTDYRNQTTEECQCPTSEMQTHRQHISPSSGPLSPSFVEKSGYGNISTSSTDEIGTNVARGNIAEPDAIISQPEPWILSTEDDSRPRSGITLYCGAAVVFIPEGQLVQLLNESLRKIVGESALRKPADVEADDTMWAIALVVAVSQAPVCGDKSAWLSGFRELGGLMDLVKKRMSEAMFSSLVQRAMALIVEVE